MTIALCRCGLRLASRHSVLHLSCAFAVLLVCVSCSNKSPSTAVPPAGEAAPSGGSEDHSAPHGNHDPRHEGVVYMKGDLHFEVVLSQTGHHRVFFSDAARAELPAATASELTLTFSNGEAQGQTLKAEIDESGESWVATGLPLNGTDVTARVAFVVNDEPYWIDVPYLESAGVNRAQP